MKFIRKVAPWAVALILIPAPAFANDDLSKRVSEPDIENMSLVDDSPKQLDKKSAEKQKNKPKRKLKKRKKKAKKAAMKKRAKIKKAKKAAKRKMRKRKKKMKSKISE